MGNAYFQPDYAGIGEAMRSKGVRDALRKRAEDIAANARTLSAGSGLKAEITVAESVRPQGKGRGRPEAQVRAEPAADADGAARARLLSLLKASGRVL
ncbi:hypothetical protein HNR23_002237 [Nocardiopsis mwathae]|uniref:HK97 gp10 family phage protein n=1 Tax=Nocardiopsis mwathae TaxID=1472723 RepID=A0A7W9YHE4_9ACTN|nr:hypothetical protein [Nocardiopsis mwathae]MBB6172177.1 hypothetical protein [Nocardiopsis mwathae]